MSRKPLELEKIRSHVNIDASAIVATVLLLCDEMERVTQERNAARVEAALYKRGIEAYRQEHHSQDDPCGPDDEPCAVCQWEDEAEAREAER
jgi:hypothetical protein